MKLEQKDFSFFKHFNHTDHEEDLTEENYEQEEVLNKKPKKNKKQKNHVLFLAGLLTFTIVFIIGLSLPATGSHSNFMKTNKTLVYQLLSSHSRFDTFSDTETSIFKTFQDKNIPIQFLFANEKLLALKAQDGSNYQINVSTITPTYYQIEYSNLNKDEFEWANEYFTEENFPTIRLNKFAYQSKKSITVMIGGISESAWPTILMPEIKIEPAITENAPASPSQITIPNDEKPMQKALPLPIDKNKLQKQMDELNRQSIHDSMQNMPVYEQRQMDAKTMIRLQQQLELARQLTNTIAK